MGSPDPNSLIDGSFFKDLPEKPTIVSLGKGQDYFQLFTTLRSQFKTSYLLESLELNEHSDPVFTFGFDPVFVLRAKGDRLEIVSRGGQAETISAENPYQEIAKLIPDTFQGEGQEGGLIGSISYEAVNYFEPSLQLDEHPDFETIEMGLYLDGLNYNSKTQSLEYYSYGTDRSELVKEALENPKQIGQLEEITKLGNSKSREEHKNAVNHALDQIKRGNSFQVEIGFKTKYQIKGDRMAVYSKLREVNPGPYMFYFKFGEREMFGSSPEIIVRNTGGKLLTTPAAGTVKRGDTPEEDKKLADSLLNDPKENAEHNMLIDLHRNDLSRVAKIGSVKVDAEKYIGKFSHVQHMLSDISGDLAADKNSFDVLAALTPCGVLTGAPKIETIKIIRQTEPEARGPYGGAVGRFSLNGDCVFTMPIRSMFCAGDSCYAQTASGIVLDSDPEAEYQEVTKKLAAMEKVVSELES